MPENHRDQQQLKSKLSCKKKHSNVSIFSSAGSTKIVALRMSKKVRRKRSSTCSLGRKNRRRCRSFHLAFSEKKSDSTEDYKIWPGSFFVYRYYLNQEAYDCLRKQLKTSNISKESKS